MQTETYLKLVGATSLAVNLLRKSHRRQEEILPGEFLLGFSIGVQTPPHVVVRILLADNEFTSTVFPSLFLCPKFVQYLKQLETFSHSIYTTNFIEQVFHF